MQSMTLLRWASHCNRMLLAYFLVGVLSSCTDSSTTRNQSEIPSEIVNVIEEYISTNKKWPKDDYTLRFIERENSHIIVSVDHNEDKKSLYTVGGELSIALVIDLNTLEVLRELGYQ